jgi:uncharacterized protein (TIGR00297 family)
VAALARRAGALTVGGQWAAFATGILVAAAGWPWAVLLVAYFVSSASLSWFGAADKDARARSVLPEHHGRNALQVLANGGLFAIAVVAGEVTGDPRLLLAGLGALAAAAADTWATEYGLLRGGMPRSIISGRTLPPGISGGVTLAGTAASLVAAGFVAAAGTVILASHVFLTSLVIAGIGGSLVDSVLGATLQSKRWCEQCRTWTERRVHTCGYRTRHARGLRWMTNDSVNFLATVAGASLALVAASR